MKQEPDPAIERIREVRHRISEEHGHDPQRIVEYYLELQKKYQPRPPDEAAAEKHSETVEA